jgi:phosphoribosyl-ATP pyrophosphohydrolase
MAKDAKKKKPPAPGPRKPGGKARKGAPLPLPPGLDSPMAVAPKAVAAAEARHLEAYRPPADSGAAVLDALWQVVEQRRQKGDVANSHSARLIARGTQKVAQKLGEEAVELVIEAAVGNRAATVLESADLLYHLIVIWVDAGIEPGEVWTELARRQGISGIVEKAARPRGLLRSAGTTKLP